MSFQTNINWHRLQITLKQSNHQNSVWCETTVTVKWKSALHFNIKYQINKQASVCLFHKYPWLMLVCVSWTPIMIELRILLFYPRFILCYFCYFSLISQCRMIWNLSNLLQEWGLVFYCFSSTRRHCILWAERYRNPTFWDDFFSCLTYHPLS